VSMRRLALAVLFLVGEARANHSSEHSNACDESALATDESAYQRTLQTAAADLCLESPSAVAAAAASPLPERAVVHVSASNLAAVSSRLSTLSADARLTLLVSGAEDQATPPGLDALLKDARVAHVFRLVHGATMHESSEGSESHGRSKTSFSKASKLTMLPTHRRGPSACEQLRSHLEEVWGVHEAALLEQDRSGSALAQYYRTTAHPSPRLVPQYGTKLYYVYAEPYSDVNCEQRYESAASANGTVAVPVVTCVTNRRHDWWYDDWYDSGWAIGMYVILGLCFASAIFYLLFYVVFDGHKKSYYDSV